MIVTSAPGTRCPKEGRPREYIGDEKVESVPNTTYYKRLVAEGSLVLAKEAPDEVKSKRGGDK
jgi:hypothetical protein